VASGASGPAFTDRLGTNRASGARFRPYGDEMSSTGNDREKFATYQRDWLTGLDYADQRYYASSYGRFNTADPMAGSAGARDPGSWNRYSYTNGDPVSRSDPRGLCVEDGQYNYWDNAEDVPDSTSILEEIGAGDCVANSTWVNQVGSSEVTLNGSPYQFGNVDFSSSSGTPGAAPTFGGGGSLLTVATELWTAYETDIAALNNPKCAILFGTQSGIHPTTVLTDLYYGIGDYVSVSIGAIAPPGPGLIVNATTTQETSTNVQTGQVSNAAYILINDSAGVFINGSAQNREHVPESGQHMAG